jgi:hypothetical protein
METDSFRKTAFSTELKNCENEIRRLAMAEQIPDAFEDIKPTIQDNAFGVLEAILNLVGEQLLYFTTVGGQIGLSPRPISAY